MSDNTELGKAFLDNEPILSTKTLISQEVDRMSANEVWEYLAQESAKALEAMQLYASQIAELTKPKKWFWR